MFLSQTFHECWVNLNFCTYIGCQNTDSHEKLWASLVAQWQRIGVPMQETQDLGSIHGPGRSPGEGNGDPLQYSCLGSPMDRGAWQATVHGVTKNQIWLSNWTTTWGTTSVSQQQRNHHDCYHWNTHSSVLWSEDVNLRGFPARLRLNLLPQNQFWTLWLLVNQKINVSIYSTVNYAHINSFILYHQ